MLSTSQPCAGAEVSRHRDLLSSQRGFSTCRVTPALGKIWEIRQ